MNIDIADLKHVFVSLVSVLAGYVVRMFGTEAKIKTDLAYIRGQLTQILRMVGDVDSLKIRHVTIEKDQEKMKQDINAAHAGLRKITGG